MLALTSPEESFHAIEVLILPLNVTKSLLLCRTETHAKIDRESAKPIYFFMFLRSLYAIARDGRSSCLPSIKAFFFFRVQP
jgi:hypothetical protein